MLRQAVKKHQIHSQASSQKPPARQQSLDATIKPTASPTRPLSTTSASIGPYHNTSVARPTTSVRHGVKRTSSGLAKALSSEGDIFEYPQLTASENSTAAHNTYNEPPVMANNNPPTVYFEEDDFDSDVDLDLEDPASKSTVQYPTLPAPPPLDKSNNSRDTVNTSKSPSVPQQSISSQPIPWSSSPPNHIEALAKPLPPKKDDQPRTKRRVLPWNGGHSQQAQQSPSVDEDEMASAVQSQSKRTKRETESTPLSKSTTDKYPWNTTASAVKEQQKNLRQANKKAVKSNEGSADEMAAAVAKKKRTTLPSIFLSEEQQHVLNLVVEHKKSVFFTGSAGTGKSVLLREIISALRRKYLREPDRVAVTASTGLAACNIGGITLHSFAGIGLGKESAEDLIKKIKRNQKAKQRWMRTRVLVVDEVSMVDGELFDKLEQIARIVRNNGRPFGGIQLVITGDFFQLPPVAGNGKLAKFAFDATTWTTVIEHTIGLHHVFRQKDPVFAGMLNEMREGRLTPATIAAFRALERPLPEIEAIEATELFSTRQEVDRSNSQRMQQLHGEEFVFYARDGGMIQDKNFRDKLLQNCMAPEQVRLKKGAQVMLIKNMDETLVNGSLGRVRAFMTEQMFEEYKNNEERFLKDGGGMPYDADARAYQKAKILGLDTKEVYPMVRFTNTDGTTRDVLCKTETWKFEHPNGEVQASRDQVPLILAWALSIHKAQGQTLERVRVDLGRVFEKGQAYVALSRATSMEGLQVLRFDPKKVLAHERVRSFYSSLSKAEHTVVKKAKLQSLDDFAYEERFVGQRG